MHYLFTVILLSELGFTADGLSPELKRCKFGYCHFQPIDPGPSNLLSCTEDRKCACESHKFSSHTKGWKLSNKTGLCITEGDGPCGEFNGLNIDCGHDFSCVDSRCFFDPKLASVNETCVKEDDCQAGLNCEISVGGWFRKQRTCQEPKIPETAEDSCGDINYVTLECNVGFSCIEGHCIAEPKLAAVNETCAVDRDCVEGLNCTVTASGWFSKYNICQEPKAPELPEGFCGKSNGVTIQCNIGFLCVDGHCVPEPKLAALNKTCVLDSDCVAGLNCTVTASGWFSKYKTCQEPKAPELPEGFCGESDGITIQCNVGFLCVDGHCDPEPKLATVNKTCVLDSDCVAGLNCTVTVSGWFSKYKTCQEPKAPELPEGFCGKIDDVTIQCNVGFLCVNDHCVAEPTLAAVNETCAVDSDCVEGLSCVVTKSGWFLKVRTCLETKNPDPDTQIGL